MEDVNYMDIDQLSASNKNYLKRSNCKKADPAKLNAVQSPLPNAMVPNSWLNMKTAALGRESKIEECHAIAIGFLCL